MKNLWRWSQNLLDHIVFNFFNFYNFCKDFFTFFMNKLWIIKNWRIQSHFFFLISAREWQMVATTSMVYEEVTGVRSSWPQPPRTLFTREMQNNLNTTSTNSGSSVNSEPNHEIYPISPPPPPPYPKKTVQKNIQPEVPYTFILIQCSLLKIFLKISQIFF